MHQSAPILLAGIVDFLDTSSPAALGRLTAQLLMGSLLFFGIVKCVVLMRRKTTSTLCVLPLLSFLLIITLGMVVSVLTRSLGVNASMFSGLIGLLMIFLLIGGLVCGIVGLTTYGPPGGKYVQGRSQAIWGLILHGLFLILMITGIVIAMVKRGSDLKSGGRPASGTWGEHQDIESNCSIRVPGNSWLERDPKPLGERVSILLTKSQPEISQMMACDMVPDPLSVDLESEVEAWKTRIKASNSLAHFTDAKRLYIHGQEFVHFSANSFNPRMGKTMAFDCWSTVQAGRYYQLMTFGVVQDLDQIEACGRYVAESFRILEPGKDPSGISAPFRDAVYHPWGFSTQLARLGWKNWPRAEEDFKAAVFSAVHAKDSYIGIIPLPMQSTPIDMPTAATALLAVNGGLSWSNDLSTRKSIRLPGADEAIHATADVQHNGIPIHYELRVVRQGKRYLLLLAWANTKVQKDTRFLIQALDAISIHPLEKLPDLTKSSQQSRQKMGLCLHQCGLAAYARKEYLQSANLFQESLALSLSNPKTLVNAAYALREAGQVQAGMDLLKSYDGLFPDDQELSFVKGLFEVATGEPGGRDHLLDLFQNGYRNEDDLSTTLQVLVDSGRAEDGVRMINHYLEAGESTRVKRLQALAYAHSGDDRRAMDILEKLIKEEPFDIETSYQFGETANKAKEPDKAVVIATRLIKEGYDGARTRMIEGWAHAGKDEWRQAKESFEMAAKFAPNEASISEAIARASAFLGEGDNSGLKNPIPALKIPSNLADQIEKAAAIPATEKTGAQFLSRVTIYQFRKQEPLVTSIFQDFKLLDSSAIADFSTLIFPFDPLSEEIYVNSVIVKNPDGSEAARVKPEEQYIVDESASSAMASQRKQLRIAVPGLKEGRTVHVVVTLRSKSIDSGFPWLRKPFISSRPVNLEAVVVIADPKAYRVSGNEDFNKRAEIIRNGDIWQAVISPVPQLYAEESLPPVDSFLPVLSLADSDAEWTSVAKEYTRELEDCLRPEESVNARAHQIADPLKSNMEKIQALARFVQKEITYQGLEFGKRARRPNHASRVLACHYGDCKDQALLLHQMLKAIGIPSNLALASTDYDLAEELPSLDQFNHMIVYVPELPCAFIDTTGPNNPVGVLPPVYSSKKSLVLDSAKARIVAFPEPSRFLPDEVRIDRVVDFEKSGTIVVNEKVSVTGYYGSTLRAYFSGQTQEQKLASYQAMLRRKVALQLDEIEINGMESVGEPLLFSYQYTIPGGVGARRIPSFMEETILGVTYGKSRHHPFIQFHDLKLESHTKINSSIVIGDKDFNRSGSDEFLQWEMRSSGHDMSFKATRSAGKRQASEYGAFYDSAQKVIGALATPLK